MVSNINLRPYSTVGERQVHDQEKLRAEIERLKQALVQQKNEHEHRERALQSQLSQAKDAHTRLERKIGDTTLYTVLVYTSNVKGAGTSANVTCNIIGSHDRSSGDMPLEQVGATRGVFKKGQMERFTLECGYLGDIRSVIIGHDSSGYGPSWHLDKVTRCNKLDPGLKAPPGFKL